MVLKKQAPVFVVRECVLCVNGQLGETKHARACQALEMQGAAGSSVQRDMSVSDQDTDISQTKTKSVSDQETQDDSRALDGSQQIPDAASADGTDSVATSDPATAVTGFVNACLIFA
jgi:monoamine oxidase